MTPTQSALNKLSHAEFQTFFHQATRLTPSPLASLVPDDLRSLAELLKLSYLAQSDTLLTVMRRVLPPGMELTRLPFSESLVIEDRRSGKWYRHMVTLSYTPEDERRSRVPVAIRMLAMNIISLDIKT